METKTFSELIDTTDAMAGFGILPSLPKDEQARQVQSMVASADLCEVVPEELVLSFDRLRRLFAYGLFYYETFTVVEDQAWLTMEHAFRTRFMTYFQGRIPVIAKAGDTVLKANNFDDVYKAFGKGGLHRGRNIRVRATGQPLKGWRAFNGSFGQLQAWARQEGLLSGVGNIGMEALHEDFRNWAAHPHRHVVMPTQAALTVRDLAEVINRLWGELTPQGRLHPAPLVRVPVVIGWSHEDPPRSTVKMSVEYLGQHGELYQDWTFIVVRAVPTDDRLDEFDSRFECTVYPAELFWGPGTAAMALEWLAQHPIDNDSTTFQDRFFAVQRVDGRTYMPRRPDVALGLPPNRRGGVWYLIRADYPLHALAHARHGGGAAACQGTDPMSGCRIEERYVGPWEDLAKELGGFGVPPARTAPAVVAVPLRHVYAPDIAKD